MIAMIRPENNWTTNNNAVPLLDAETERYIAVRPSARQLRHAEKPFYLFMHFGMNTATGREWGNGTETAADFTITHIDPKQWVDAAEACGAGGIILTCKHHDGFCLWDTETTDFNVMRTSLHTDVAAALSAECHRRHIGFGVYLSPWDMHEPCYGTPAYNDFFCRQLTELLTRYGPIFEVWFDGAKGKDAKAFSYDWARYYEVVRTLQPDACISICGPDLRWVGNEGGRCRKSEFSVVPEELTKAEAIKERSQQTPEQAKEMRKLTSRDEDLGSRDVLRQHEALTWYPAEVDVSIRRGWFHPGGGKVKSPRRLMRIYRNAVGNNCALLLNVPPDKNGRIDEADLRSLTRFGEMIRAVTAQPLAVFHPGVLTKQDGVLTFDLPPDRKVRYCILSEDIAQGQRVEQFDLYLLNRRGSRVFSYRGTVIGSRKIIPVGRKAAKVLLIVRQSRGAPILKDVGFYA